MNSISCGGHRITWFNPYPWKWTDPNGHVWYDHSAERNGEGRAASGLSIEVPGIALPTHYTLKGWWKLHLPGNVVVTTQQVDIGPAGTGTVDLNAALAWQVYKTPDKVEFGPWSAVYLGQDKPISNT